MKKSKFLFIALVVMLSLTVSKNIFAEQLSESTQPIEENDPEKDQIIQVINEYLDEIELKIGNIDKRIENIRLQEEFAYYPAIRLNVDSPILGMTSVIENRLRVKRDISTSDVAAKYSIRDIVKNKTIKLPESFLGSIVVSTVDVNIDSTMELPQAKLALIKCIQYLSQVNSASEFVDSQTNKIFKDYISDNKKQSIKSIKDRNSKIESDLETIADQIKIQELLGKDVSTYKSEYSTISSGLYEVSQAIKNQLILEEDLLEVTKKSVNLEADILDLKDTVSKAYNESLKDIDYSLFLENVYKDLEVRTTAIDEYISNSTTEVTEIIEKNDEESADENTQVEKVEEIKTVVNYDVTSNATLDYMKIVLDEIETLKEDYDTKLKEESNLEDKNENIENEEQKELTQEEINKIIEENKNKINSVYSKYKEFLSREYKFYTNNINMLLKDSNDKISSIIAEIDSGIEIDNEIFNYTKYIYIELPNNLTEYLNENNLDSSLEIDNLINSLKVELGALLNNNINVTEMYENMISEMLES